MLKLILAPLFACLVFCAAHARAQNEGDPESEPESELWRWVGEEEEAAESREAAPTADASTPDFKRAVDLQKKGKWKSAQKVFRQLLDKYPQSVHKESADARSDDNAFLGCEVLHLSGPSERRIDVTVMGDGFTIDDPDQKLQYDWAKLCLSVLWSEFVYDEYKDYFNYYFVRLASLEEGVDPQLSEEQRAKIIERNKSRTRKKKTEFSTALDCKEAGPQGQVLADRNLVYRWMKVAGKETPGCKDDWLVIAFARFGKLGMGGGGIANVGRPDKSVTVHEFGHAFVGLLDEYAVNPGTPFQPVSAPNASMTDDPERVPWAHFLKKNVGGVGVFKGGATYIEGVWRPARSCAMNSAGHINYCPVCREAAILRVYSYVDPIDAYDPPTTQEIEINAGTNTVLAVTPMRPKSKPLDVAWFVEEVDAGAPGPVTESRTSRTTGRNRVREALFGRFTGGERVKGDRSALDAPPPGEKNPLGTTRKRKDGKVENVFNLSTVKPGRYRITAVVADRSPHVLLDTKHLLEERKTWWVKVVQPSATAR
jgi:hypothetical protein